MPKFLVFIEPKEDLIARKCCPPLESWIMYPFNVSQEELVRNMTRAQAYYRKSRGVPAVFGFVKYDPTLPLHKKYFGER